jgi:hypothetical protein
MTMHDFYPTLAAEHFTFSGIALKTHVWSLSKMSGVLVLTLLSDYTLVSFKGGAGEGKQHLKPNGEQKNKQEVKSDAALPAYCEPPNPCPKGYTGK